MNLIMNNYYKCLDLYYLRLTSDPNTEWDRRLQAENAQKLDKVALGNLQQELDLERKNLRSTKSGYKARLEQLSTGVEHEDAKWNDLQGVSFELQCGVLSQRDSRLR